MDKLIEAVMVMTEACDRFQKSCRAANAEPERATGDQGRMYRAGRLISEAALHKYEKSEIDLDAACEQRDAFKSVLCRVQKALADTSPVLWKSLKSEVDRVLSESSPSKDKWQPMDSREWGEGSPPVIIAVNNAANKGDTHYVVGEAKHHGEDGWWWAGNDPTDAWGCRVYPDFWTEIPEPPNGCSHEKRTPVHGGFHCLACGEVVLTPPSGGTDV